MKYTITEKIKSSLEKSDIKQCYIVNMPGGCWITMTQPDQKSIHLVLSEKKEFAQIWLHLASDLTLSEYDNATSLLSEAIKPSNSSFYPSADLAAPTRVRLRLSLTDDKDLRVEYRERLTEDGYEDTIIRMLDGFLSQIPVMKKAIAVS